MASLSSRPRRASSPRSTTTATRPVSVPSNEGVNPSNTYYAIGFDTFGGRYDPQAYVVPNTGLSTLISGSGPPSSGTGLKR